MIQGESDVLVIGAGPAGCAAGIELARAGRTVCVVDRARFPRPKTCGDALSNQAVELIESLGAGARLKQAPHAVVHGAVVVFPDGQRVIRLYGDRPGWIVPRTTLDDLLRRALEDAGARVVEGVQVRHLVRDGARVSGAEGDGFRWTARAVIAADGPGSVAWRAEDKPTGRRLGVSATAYFEGVAPLDDPDFSEHYFDPDLPCGYGWIFPAVEAVANVGVYLRLDTYRHHGVGLHDLLDRFIARHAPRFKSARRLGPVHTWQLPLAGPRRMLGGDGLLVCGDAGRYIDPLTGEGIWQALFSGSLAGRTAVRHLGLGGVGESAALEFHRACTRRLDWPAAARGGVQDAVRRIVDAGLHRVPPVRAALQWAYGSGTLEMSKRVAPRS